MSPLGLETGVPIDCANFSKEVWLEIPGTFTHPRAFSSEKYVTPSHRTAMPEARQCFTKRSAHHSISHHRPDEGRVAQALIFAAINKIKGAPFLASFAKGGN